MSWLRSPSPSTRADESHMAAKEGRADYRSGLPKQNPYQSGSALWHDYEKAYDRMAEERSA